jgi:hypothetical protein
MQKLQSQQVTSLSLLAISMIPKGKTNGNRIAKWEPERQKEGGVE